MHTNPRIAGCRSAGALKLGGVIVIKKVLSQLAKRYVVVIKDIFSHGKEL